MFDRVAYMKVYHKKWYGANKQRHQETGRRYVSNNGETIRSYKHEWYIKNRVVLMAKARERYAQDKSTKCREYKLRSMYGLSVAAYDALKMRQNAACAICKKVGRLSVDHCHTTRKVRGLLCQNCNFAIGLFQDNVAILGSAIQYLGEKV